MFQPVAQESGAVDSYMQLFQQLQGFKEGLHRQLDVTAQKEGLAAGRKAGLGKVNDVALPDGGTISGDAFREGANMSHFAAVKLDIAENMGRMQAESAYNPELFQARVEGYKKGLLEGTTDDVMPIASEEIDIMASKIHSGIVASVAKRDRAEHAAKIESGITLLETDLLNAAISGNPDEMSRANTQYTSMLQSAENAGLIPAGDAIRRTDNIYKRMNENVYIGSFDAALANNNGVKFLEDFDKSKDKSMQPVDKEKLLANMMARMNRRQALEGEQEQIDKDARTEVYRVTEQAVTLQALEGKLQPDTLINHLRDDTIQPSFARQMEKVAKSHGTTVDDDASKLAYAVNLLHYSELDIATDESLTIDTRIKLIKARDKLEKDTGNWKRSQSGQEAVRRIKAEFGLVDGLIAQLDPEKAKRAGRALTTLYEQIEALPLEERSLKAVDLSNEIIKKLNVGDMVKELSDVRASLGKLKYRSTAEVERAIEAGDIGGHEAKVLLRKVQNYENEIIRLEKGVGK